MLKYLSNLPTRFTSSSVAESSNLELDYKGYTTLLPLHNTTFNNFTSIWMFMGYDYMVHSNLFELTCRQEEIMGKSAPMRYECDFRWLEPRNFYFRIFGSSKFQPSNTRLRIPIIQFQRSSGSGLLPKDGIQYLHRHGLLRKQARFLRTVGDLGSDGCGCELRKHHEAFAEHKDGWGRKRVGQLDSSISHYCWELSKVT